MTTDNSKNTKISIIIPSFNRGNDFLQRCLESVLSQTHKNLEIIIVDDNNDDMYSNIVRNTVQKYPNNICKYIKTPKNLGAALSRNLGVSVSCGEYITFLDDDDVYLPQKLERQVKYMIANDLDMTFTDLGIYNMENKLIDYRSHEYINDCSNQNLIKQHVMHNLTGTPTYMFKANRLRAIGGFDNSILSEEYYLMEKAINSSLKIGYIPESYVKAFRHKMGGESFGQRKIKGEKLLYESKKKYFYLLNNTERRYTRCRYLAILAVSYFRISEYILFVMYSILAIITGPIIIIKELRKKKYLLKKHRRLIKDE